MNKIDVILQKLGLSAAEAKVYRGLLELKEARTGILCEHVQIPSSNIYKVLESLKKQGLVSYRMQNNIKIFRASPPKILNDLFAEKQKEIEKEQKEVSSLIKQLETIENEEEPESNYRYYEGMAGIKSIWHEMTSKITAKTEERIYGTKKEAYQRIVGFYDEHHKVRNRLGAKAKILIPPTDMKLGKMRLNKNTKVRYTELTNEAEWGVIDDTVYIQYIVTKKPHGFLIQDKIFAQTFREVFDKVWVKAEESP